MDDDKTKAKIKRLVEDYLDTQDKFAAEKLKANGDINTRRKAALAKIETAIGKLNITREAFKRQVITEGEIRVAKNRFTKADDGTDLDLVAGMSRVALATGSVFEPIYGDDEKKRMEELVEEQAAPPSDDEGKVVPFSDAAE